MTYEKLVNLTMTQMESLLKKCFLQIPELHEKILQPETLAEYISWMVSTFGNNPEYRLTDDSSLNYTTEQIADLGKQVLDDMQNTKALDALAECYGEQKEERFIVANHDISIGRMLRYMPAHWHRDDYFEVYYSFSGECPVCFSGDTVIVRPGTVLIVAPSVLHASPCYRDDLVLLYYMLRASTFDKVFWNQLPADSLMASFFRQALNGSQPNSYLHFETEQDPQIGRLLAWLYQEFLGKKAYCAQMLNSLMSTFFILLLRRYESSARLPRTDSFYWKHEFSAIFSYIQSNFATVKASELAQLFHYSERQITRIIQRCTGMTFAALVNKLRMEKAASLLKQDNTSITLISSLTGYSTVSSFYRAFEHYYGCTPVEYTKKACKH